MAVLSSCPEPDRLRALLDGSLPADDADALSGHLDTCEICRHTLEELVAGRESWAAIAEQLGPGPTSADSALQQAIAALKSRDNTRTGPETVADAAVDFLAPSEKPGSLGRLGEYEITEIIGRGGFGIVLKAFDEELHRVVAIKVLNPALATSGTARKRFLREAKAAAAVSHDHVVTIHAVNGSNNPPYLVMQHISGVSLQDRLDKRGPVELKEVLRIGAQAASGLAAAHSQGLVHRDIKPANILLETGSERVKITDFGLARAADDASLSQSGVIAGTPQFMAPEQARGEAIDHRADLFSLGSVLYTLCTGRAPFRAVNAMAVLKRVCEEDPRPIREINPDIPDWLCAIIGKLHAKDPKDRIQSAKEVAELLGQHLAHLQQPGQVPMPAPLSAASRAASAAGLPDPRGDASRLARRRRVWLAAAIALVLAGAAAVSLRLFLTRTGLIRLEFDDPTVVVTLDGPEGSYESRPGQDFHFYWNRPGRWTLRAFKDKRLIYTRHVDLAPGQNLVLRVPGEPPPDSAKEDGWVQLFNGTNLAGWKTHPNQPGNWTVEQGILIGRGPGQVSHLFSERGDYTDFHLRAVAKINYRGNSGIYFRCPPARLDLTKELTDLEVARQAWTIAEAKVDELKAGALPSEIRKAQADLGEAKARRNLAQIGLDKASEADKAARLAALGEAEARVRTTTEALELLKQGPRPEQIAAADAELGRARAVFALAQDRYRRAALPLLDGPYPTGYEAQIFIGDTSPLAKDLERNRTGSLYRFKPFHDILPKAGVDDWFNLEVIARGNRITIKVNGTTTVDEFEDKANTYTRGHFALQQAGADTVVEFKKIEIKELPPTPPAQLVAAELAKLQGRWVPVSGEFDGKPLADDLMKQHIPTFFVITNDKWGSVTDGKPHEGGLAIDPSKDPKQIEFTGAVLAEKAYSHGVYAVEGDLLKFCLAEKKDPRPTSFDTAGSQTCAVVVYRRKDAAAEAGQLIHRFGSDDVLLSPNEVVPDQGGWRIAPTEKAGVSRRLVRLFEVTNLDLRGGLLTGRAQLKTSNLQGRAYLQLKCQREKGVVVADVISKPVLDPVSGTTDWLPVDASYLIGSRERVKAVRVELIIEGEGRGGTIWIKDVTLRKANLLAGE